MPRRRLAACEDLRSVKQNSGVDAEIPANQADDDDSPNSEAPGPYWHTAPRCARFAIIFLLNLEIAYLAPPLGINLFISSLRFGRPVTQLYTSVLTFIAVLFVTLMIVIVVAVAFSRTYLRAHWFSDVVGGMTLGVAWLFLCLGWLERMRLGQLRG